jgi:hypothetical protein
MVKSSMVNGQIVNRQSAIGKITKLLSPAFPFRPSAVFAFGFRLSACSLKLEACSLYSYIAGHTKGTRFAFTALLPMIDNDSSKLFDLPLIFDRSLVPTS